MDTESDSAPTETDPLAEGLAEDHTEQAPEPSEHAIAAEEEKEQTAPTDDFGEPFDPAKHQAHADGTPKKTKAGRWAKKPGAKKGSEPHNKANRSSASTLSTGSRAGGRGQNSGQDEGATEQEYRMAAEGLVNTVYMLGNMIGGDEWSPVQQTDDKGNIVYDEYVYGVDVWERYFRAKGIQDVPPGMAVTIWTLVVVGPRVTQGPNTREKAAYLFGSLKEKWRKWRKKRQKAKKREGE